MRTLQHQIGNEMESVDKTTTPKVQKKPAPKKKESAGVKPEPKAKAEPSEDSEGKQKPIVTHVWVAEEHSAALKAFAKRNPVYDISITDAEQDEENERVLIKIYQRESSKARANTKLVSFLIAYGER